MADPAPTFSVLIVNYNAGPHLKACLNSLSQQSFQDFETIIIDNGSDDGSLDLGALPERTTIIEAGENLGFAAANNLGADRATGTWLALLNPDAFAEPGWLAEIKAGIDRYSDASIFASVQLLNDRPELLDGAGDPYHALGVAWRGDRLRPASPPPPEGDVFGPCGAAAVYKRDAFLSAGGFEEKFFCYYEDVDLAFRLRLMGKRCVLLPNAKVRHIASAISGEGSDFVIYHVTRNRIWTFLRCMPGPLLLLLALPVAATIVAKLIAAALSGRFGIRLKALGDVFSEMKWAVTSRKNCQNTRTISTFAVAKALTWSPTTLLQRRSDIRTR